MESKLILVEGVNGTERQKLAQKIYYSLGADRSCWIPEETDNNPLIIDDYKSQPWSLNTRIPMKDVHRIVNEIPRIWSRFSKTIAATARTYILDGILFEKTIRVLYQNDVPENTIIAKFREITSEMNELQPFLIYLYPDDYAKQLEEDFLRNGEKWRDHIINDVWGVCRKMDTFQAIEEQKTYKFVTAYGAFIDNLYELCTWRKTKIAKTDDMNSMIKCKLSVEPYPFTSRHHGGIEGKYTAVNGNRDSLEISRSGGRISCTIQNTYFQDIELLSIDEQTLAFLKHPIEIRLRRDDIELRSAYSGESCHVFRK